MITQETIEEVKNRLVKAYNPLKIYLFGSYAWGTPHEDSDLDLCIIIETSDEKRHKRGKRGYEVLWGLGIAKDFMIFTKEEFEQKASDPNSFVYKIAHEGKELYARA